MEKCKKRKISEENRIFNDAWADSFAFTSNESGLPIRLICGEKLANNKRSNVARHFNNTHKAFAEKYPDEERKKAVKELMWKADLTKHRIQEVVEVCKFNYICEFCGRSGNSQAWETVHRWRICERIFPQDFRTAICGLKNKCEIVQKIRDAFLCEDSQRQNH